LAIIFFFLVVYDLLTGTVFKCRYVQNDYWTMTRITKTALQRI
jgi:hypothetical protein